MPITGLLNGKAAAPDLSHISGRPPVGLNNEVRSTFKNIWSPDYLTGLLGFEFTQFGLRYEVRYKDDLGNDTYSFKLTVPKDHPYLHREKEMGIAEKAHAFLMVLEMMDENIESQNRAHWKYLERACFDPHSGTVEQGFTGVIPFAQTAKMITHYGLHFPTDENYERAPEVRVFSMEWVSGIQHKLIDNSRIVADFISSATPSRNVNRMYMSHADTVKAIEYAKTYAERADAELYETALRTNLWRKLEYALIHVPINATRCP